MQVTRIAQVLLLIAASLSAAVALFFGWLYYAFYWQYRGLFNEEGRYFDEQNLVVHNEQTSVLIAPAIGFLLLAALFGVAWWLIRRKVAQQTAKV